MSMKHLNNNLLVAVGLVTDGNGPLRYQPTDRLNDPDTGNICQLCLIPVDAKMRQLEGVAPFNVFFKPRNLDTFPKKSNMAAGWSSDELILKGYDEGAVLYVFETWFDALPIRENKKLVPLAFNWPLTRAWLLTLFSERMFRSYFEFQYRDLLAIMMYQNDWSYAHREPYRYQHPAFSQATTTLQVGWDARAKDAALDAWALVQMYDKIMLRFLM